MENNEMEVTQEAPRPQDHWLVVGAIKAARALIKAADDLSFAAQITGGTAGRDAALCAAIAQWTAERDKQKQMLRIIELEGDDPEIGAGFELCASPLTTALAAKEAENAELRAALMNVRDWAASLTVTDMNEIVADNGITAGMVVGQEAGEQVRRIDRAIATLAETHP